LPELAKGFDRLLCRKGLDELASRLSSLRVFAAGRHGLYFVPPDFIKRPPDNVTTDRSKWSFMYHPARKRYWLGQVPRRRWLLTLEVIDGEPAVLHVDSAAGTLHEKLLALQRELGT